MCAARCVTPKPRPIVRVCNANPTTEKIWSRSWSPNRNSARSTTGKQNATELVRQEAEQRRFEQRLEGARALARMRDRGETVASIAQLGGCSTKLVRRYLKELQAELSVAGTNLDDD